MKKRLLVLALCAAASMTVSVAAEASATAPKANVKPKIDGVIDEVWSNADRMYGEVYGGDLLNDKIVASYASLMWDEEGLYLLGVMYDTTIPKADADARNSIDFWVSETYSEDVEYAEDGDWHYCKASTGEEVYYTGNETVYEEATTAVAVYDGYYVVEIFVPWQTAGFAPAIGTEIGFNVSFNDDADCDGTRDMYSYWQVTDVSEAYWEQTRALPRIAFVAGPEIPAETPAQDVDVTVTDTPVVEPEAAAPVTTPVTADAGIVAAAAVMAAAAGIVLSKKH
ncbi:MAG: hypothetical protein J6I50_08430 [Clostridia bacterium]|nr:hypothetical protein [Clostridia bacterium]